MHSPVRSRFSTTNPEEGRALIAEAYADNRLRVGSSIDDYELTHSRTDLGEVRLDDFHDAAVTEYTVQPLDRVTVFRVQERGLRLRVGRHERSAGPGDVLLAAHPDQSHASCLDGIRMQIVGVDLSLISAVSDSAAEHLRRLHYEPLEPAAARHWQSAVSYLRNTVPSNEAAANSPLVLSAAGRLLAATLLTIFDPESGSDRRTDRVDATPAAVRRAVTYIEANPDLDISVVDVARSAHVSVRALQLAFRRHLDTTPLRYLRRVRLDRAHADLADAAAGDGSTVTLIAARWGYSRPSRFAAEYRAAYGQHPRETLQS